MIMLLALPAVAAVAIAHRYLMLYAPSNVLIARVRSGCPTFGRAACLSTLALALTAIAHALTETIASGAAGWLHLVVLVLLWDAIKFAAAAGVTLVRTVTRSIRVVAG